MSWLKRRGLSISPRAIPPPERLPHDVSRWLPVLICVMCRSRLACLSFSHSLSYPSRPSLRRACRASLRPVSSRCFAPSHLIRLFCPLSLRPLASFCLPSPFLVSPGGASCVSLSSRHAFRLPSCVLAYRPASRSSSWCGCGCHRLACLMCGCGCHRLVHAFRCYRSASASSRLCGLVLLSLCLCYTVCCGDGGHRMGAFVPGSISYYSLGASWCSVKLSRGAPLLFPSSFISSYRSAYPNG